MKSPTCAALGIAIASLCTPPFVQRGRLLPVNGEIWFWHAIAGKRADLNRVYLRQDILA